MYHLFFQFMKHCDSESIINTRRGRSRGVLVADATNFEGPKVPNFVVHVSEQSRMSTLSVQKV